MITAVMDDLMSEFVQLSDNHALYYHFLFKLFLIEQPIKKR